MPTLLDSSAWIELFVKGPRWDRVKEILNGGDCHTSIATIAEVANWADRQKIDPNMLIDIIERTTTVLLIDMQIAKSAGRINFERKKSIKKWGMLDSLIFATALKYSLKVISKDPDFNGLPGVEML